jgi:hypothetical protein
MKIRAWIVRLPLLVVTAGLVGFNCNGNGPPPPPEANRGVFGAAACADADRVGVDASAAYAIYIDANGQPTGDRAEDLTGTESNRMCPMPGESGPGACPAGYCPRTISGKTYCLRC